MTTRKQAGKRWKPEFCGNYFYLDKEMRVRGCIWKNDSIGMGLLMTHNLFRTKSEAQAMRKKILRVLREG